MLTPHNWWLSSPQNWSLTTVMIESLDPTLMVRAPWSAESTGHRVMSLCLSLQWRHQALIFATLLHTCNYPITSNSIIKILSHDMTMVSLWYWVMSLCLSLHFSHRALVFSTHFTFTRLNMTWPCNYWIISLCFSLALDICHILQAIVRSEPIISFGDSSGSGCCHYTGPNVFTVSGARLNWEESLVPVESPVPPWWLHHDFE